MALYKTNFLDFLDPSPSAISFRSGTVSRIGHRPENPAADLVADGGRFSEKAVILQLLKHKRRHI